MLKEFVVMFECVQIPAQVVVEIKLHAGTNAHNVELEARKMLCALDWICTGIDSTQS